VEVIIDDLLEKRRSARSWKGVRLKLPTKTSSSEAGRLGCPTQLSITFFVLKWLTKINQTNQFAKLPRFRGRSKASENKKHAPPKNMWLHRYPDFTRFLIAGGWGEGIFYGMSGVLVA